MRVIGTSGHVDHGKSTLVQRLTQIDPDRLKEEKERKLTIDLGFAWFTLGDEMIGVVDVPGHRDFIENMLAGVGGIDAVMLVIAADEGVMPQTREHLAILDLLGVSNGLVALTKCDMVDDEEWLDLVETEIDDLLGTTALANTPIVRVSAKTGTGIPNLLNTLATVLTKVPPRSETRTPHLPIDRVFTIDGFGTVVTGTLNGGVLRVGDEVEIQPGDRRGKIRGLQSYEQSVEHAQPGSRVAVNVSGVNKKAIARGHRLTLPNTLKPTILVDARFRHLPDAPRPLKHNAEVKLFLGAAQTLAHVRLLDADTLTPGSEGWLQLRLHNPTAIAPGDRFILRTPSPKETIGGGVIVNPYPGKKHKRFRQDVIAALEVQLRGTPAELVAQAAAGNHLVAAVEIKAATGFADEELDTALASAQQEGLLFKFGERYIAVDSFQALIGKMERTTANYHDSQPLRLGIPREVLRSQLEVEGTLFEALLEHAEHIILEHEGALLRLSHHTIQFSEHQLKLIRTLLMAMTQAPTAPPSYKEAVDLLGNNEAILRALIDLREIVQVSADVIFTESIYDEMVNTTLDLLDAGEDVSVKTLRDHFQTSRKYAMSFLEHLDAIGITKRVGDQRVRGNR